jgi:polyferredoxin
MNPAHTSAEDGDSQERGQLVSAAIMVPVAVAIVLVVFGSGRLAAGIAAIVPALAIGYAIAAARGDGMRAIRRGAQLGMLALFFMLFFAATFPMDSRIVPDLFLRADPLAALSVLLGRAGADLARMWPALVIVVLTVALGRVFCGWVCPLGTTIDIFDHFFFRRIRRSQRLRVPALKYYVLVAALVAALLSVQVGHYVDPIPLLTRTVALVFHPVGVFAYNSTVGAGAAVGDGLAGSSNSAVAATGERLKDLRTYHRPSITFRTNLISFTIFAVILGLSAYGRRFWCRNVCPLGALLALFGRYGLLKRVVTDDCTECMRCVSECKMSAVPEDPHGTVLRECIQCWDCTCVCPEDANPIAWTTRAKSEADAVELGVNRRRLVQALATGGSYALLAQTAAARTHRGEKLIRPPGAMHIMSEAGLTDRPYTEADFLATCIRCGECMKACITNCLQPAIGEGGWEAFWTPIIVPRIGYCEKICNICGTVCPTGALRFFYITEKEDLISGIAKINKSTCIAWYDDRACAACDEACHYKAVEVKPIPQARPDGVTVVHRRPVVYEDLCTGCGECEKACPVKPDAAIVVYAPEKQQ